MRLSKGCLYFLILLGFLANSACNRLDNESTAESTVPVTRLETASPAGSLESNISPTASDSEATNDTTPTRILDPTKPIATKTALYVAVRMLRLAVGGGRKLGGARLDDLGRGWRTG